MVLFTWPVGVRGFELTGCNMRWFPVTLFAAFLSGCVGIGGPTSTSLIRQSDFISPIPRGDQPYPGYGTIPILVILAHLQAQGIVRDYPRISLLDNLDFSVPVSQNSRISDVLKTIESARGWVYDPETRDFYYPPASHSLEGPDAFGRVGAGNDRVGVTPRAMIAISFLFRRASGGVTAEEISIGGDGTIFRASIPEGVQANWSSGQNRSYFEGVQSPESDSSNNVVRTERKTVSAGISLDALACRLPGGKFRIDGNLSVSSFTGATLDTAEVEVPLQFDGDRGKWQRILTIAGGDAGIRAAFQGSRAFRAASASGSALEVFIRVD